MVRPGRKKINECCWEYLYSEYALCSPRNISLFFFLKDNEFKTFMALVCVCFCPKSFNILHCRKLAASWSFNLTEQRVSQLRSMTYTSPAHISQVVCNLFSFTSLPAACQTVFCSGTGMISLPDAIFVFDTSQEQILQESTWLPIYINESMPGRPLLMRHYNSAANELQMTWWSQIWISISLKQF